MIVSTTQVARAFQRIPTWQFLVDFHKFLHSCALEEISLGRKGLMFPQTCWLSVCRERTGGYQKFPFCIQQAWQRDFMKPSIEYMHNFISPCTLGILPLDTLAASPLFLYGKHYRLFLTHIPIKVIRGMFFVSMHIFTMRSLFWFFLVYFFPGKWRNLRTWTQMSGQILLHSSLR